MEFVIQPMGMGMDMIELDEIKNKGCTVNTIKECGCIHNDVPQCNCAES